MVSRKCVLYLTDDCSLCDEALNMLFGMDSLSGVVLTTVDVATDERLFAKFGHRIPVLESRERYLDWPFSAHDAINLIGV